MFEDAIDYLQAK